MKRSLGILLVAALASAAGAQDTTAGRGITLVGNYDPARDKISIIVMPVSGAFGDSVKAIVERDLKNGDRFNVLPIDTSDPASLRAGAGLNYTLFGKLGATAVAQITQVPGALHVSLHDVATSKVANVGEFPVSTVQLGRDWRMGVHRASDEIERWATGQKGISATRVAYVRGSGDNTAIRIVDSDGANEITVPAEACSLSPSWNPTATMIAYTTCGAASRVLVIDLSTGRSRTLVGPTRNTNYSTPVFGPDGNTVFFTRTGETSGDLYSVNVSGGDPKRLTFGRSVLNSSPTMSPDGRQIVYMSNGTGHPELYIMDADGPDGRVLTDYEESDRNYRSDPDWSPDGRLIAYQERVPNGRFQIRTIKPNGYTPKLMTSEGENEQPAWAPDARHIVFTSSRTGVRQLWIMDIETSATRQLTHSAGSRVPSWSPRIAVP
jgi:TolB protein